MMSNSRLFDPNLNNRTIFGATGPAGPPGPVGPPGPGSSPMTPFVEGTAFGETSTGRTLLGYGVDAGSNNLGLWASSIGAPQNPCNAGMSVTEFFDTNTSDAVLLNGVYIGTEGSIKSSNLSNSILIQRNSFVEGVSDWTRNLLMLYDYTANAGDRITRSLALMTGQFSTDSNFDQSLLVGDMTGVDSPGIFDALCLRTPGSTANLTMAKNTGYIGNGQTNYVMNPSDFMIETYSSYFLKTLRPDNTTGQIAYYEPGTGELTYGPEPTPYILSAKQPTVLGGQLGLNSNANNSEVNGRNSFNNYSALPVQLSGVTAVGNNLYQNSTPASNSFSNSIFLGRSHQFTGAATITNSMIAANIVGINSISKIQDCNMAVPRAASLTFGYVGEINGANFFSSGNIACTTDPLFSSVFSSGGTVNPGQTNLVLTAAPTTNSIIMKGQGNTLIQGTPSAFTYNHPNFSNCTTILGGSSAVSATANLQFVINHNTFRMPNVLTVSGAILAANLTPMYWDASTGLISPTVSSRASRVWRGIGTTDAAGQVIFTPGGGLNPSTVGYTVNLTVVNNSTTIAYTAQVENLTATQIFARVFRSVTVALASPSMTLAAAGITLHATMAW